MDFGRIVQLDLTTSQVKEYEFTAEMACLCLGGFGFNVDVLAHNLAPEADPLGPENILLITRGLLTGSAAPSSSRVHVNALSPQSGLMGSSNVGGMLGLRMAELGLFSLIITGRAAEPVYIHLSPQGLEIRPAAHLWGLDTRRTDELLRQETGPGKKDTLVIGPAGENLVRFACLMSGPDHAAGRTGMGAVLGSKRLKGLVLESEGGRLKAGPAAAQAARDFVAALKGSRDRFNDYATYGSAADVQWANDAGVLGTRNYRSGTMDGVEALYGPRLTGFVTKKTSCHRCPVHCKAEIELQGRRKGFVGGRPEYETIINMGSLCGIKDPEEVLYLSNLCNILGLDTISTGSVVAFAMELVDRGLIDPEQSDGLAPRWGQAEVTDRLIQAMAYRRGLGDVLADGVARAAQKIGRGAENYAYHVKGVEIYGADPRGMMATALAYAVSMRGGDYTSVYPVPEFRYSADKALAEFGTVEAVNFQATGGKGRMVRKCMSVSSVVDSVGICKVPALSIAFDFSLEQTTALVRAITGLELTVAELFRIGERIAQLERGFNTQRGGDRRMDDLPEYFFSEIKAGPAKGGQVRLKPMVDEFYEAMGWDEQGRLTEAVIREYGLEQSVLDLKQTDLVQKPGVGQ